MAEQQILRLGCNGLTTDPGHSLACLMVRWSRRRTSSFGVLASQSRALRSSSLATRPQPARVTACSRSTTGRTSRRSGSARAGWRAGGTTTVSGGFTFSQYKRGTAATEGAASSRPTRESRSLTGRAIRARGLRAFRGAGFLTAIDATGRQVG